jgi:hypothetical protein
VASGAPLLLVKGRAGLGNRILSALTGILYARLSGRQVIVDWRDEVYSDGTVNAFRHYFSCPGSPPDDTLPRTDSVYPPEWRGSLDETARSLDNRLSGAGERRNWQRFSLDLAKLDYDEDIVVMWAYTAKINLLRPHFVGPWADYGQKNSKEILKRLLREDLLPAASIRERVDRFHRAHLSRPAVGVHVRYSDFRVHLGRILAELDALLARMPDLQVFLSTDSIEVKRLFDRRHPGTVSTPHWYPPPGERAHDNVLCPDRLEAGAEALVDLYLLARCDHLVLDTSSSFARLAVLLTDTPRENVVNVRPPGANPKASAWLHNKVWHLLRMVGAFRWAPRLIAARTRGRRRR